MTETLPEHRSSPTLAGAPERQSDHPVAPTFAAPGRQLIHTLIASVGWILFLWWWWIVIRGVSHEAVRFTLMFVGITVAVVVLITIIWSVHNMLIFKRRGPRTQLREVVENYNRDRLGRHVVFAESRDAIQREPVVQIRLEHQGKVYRRGELRQVRGVGSGIAVGSEGYEGQRAS